MRKLIFVAFIVNSALTLFSCTSGRPSPDAEANREIVRQFHSVWSSGNVDALDSLLSPDFVCHFINNIEWKGIEGTKATISGHKKSFPDWNEEIVDIIAEGDKVVTRYKSTGTHRGNFNGIDSTGKKVIIYEASIYRIADGKLVEQWGFPDEVSLRTQLRPEQ